MSAERQRLQQAIERYRARTPELSSKTDKALKGLAKELEAPEGRDTPGSRAATQAAPVSKDLEAAVEQAAQAVAQS